MTTPVNSLMSELSGHLYVDGRYQPSKGARVPVVDPATERTTAEFALATADEVETAVAAARRAQREWWALSSLDRAAALHRVADNLVALAPVIGECLTRDDRGPASTCEGQAVSRSGVSANARDGLLRGARGELVFGTKSIGQQA